MGAFEKIKAFMSQYKTQSPGNRAKMNYVPYDYSRDEQIRQKRKEEFAALLASLKRVDIQLSSEKYNRNNLIELPEVNPKNITKSTNLSKLTDFVAIDTETTGIKTGWNDVIEVSAIHFHDFEPVEIFTTLLRPRKPIPPEATEINGITDDMVRDAPKFSEIVPALEQFLGKMPIVAHNAQFDRRHLFVNGLESIGKHAVYDTWQLSKKLLDDDEVYDHKLATVCNRYMINFDGAHRSSADALACGLLFVKMLIQRIDGCYRIDDLLQKAYEK